MTESSIELSGEILRITYHDQTTAFTVAKLLSSGKETAIVGYIPLIQVGQIVKCQGNWKIDPRHGRQFSVETFSYQLPTEHSSIEKLLSSGFLKGIGPVYAKKIAAQFGKQTFSILDETPERLYEIEGLGKKRANQAIASWKEKTQLQELFILLCNWGITQSQTLKILKKWGNKAIQTIRTNPYQLAKEIRGIGFQLADKIAERLNIDPLSDIRVHAAIEFFLWELSQEGHTCFPLDSFLEIAQQKLKIPKETIEEKIHFLFKEGFVVLFTPSNDSSSDAKMCIALKALFSYEQHIAHHLSRILSTPSFLRDINIDKAISWAADTLHMAFAENQEQAIRAALQHKLLIITGGPGTGKSTITRAIVAITAKLTKKIMLVAPTGRAAKRLQEITHQYSQTIHRLLKFNPSTHTFTHNRENPLSCDLIIIDEASMIDTHLMAHLCAAIPSHARCIIIGDCDQLPSIGPGTVLLDSIKSTKIPTVRLTEIFRQARHSLIIKNAHRINTRQMPYLNEDQGDFRFIRVDHPEEIRKTVLSFVSTLLPASYGFDSKKDIQILVPMRKGDCGIDRFNSDLQHYFCQNQSKKGRFAIGDKVIQLKNNYQKEVYNGDIGFVSHIDDAQVVTVAFENRYIAYDPPECEELSLAWAVSIHKFQGSECPCIILPIHTQHFKLLNKNLLYTAVTRGKKLVVLIGNLKAVAIAVNTQNSQQRWTNLASAISAQF